MILDDVEFISIYTMFGYFYIYKQVVCYSEQVDLLKRSSLKPSSVL